MKKGTIRQLSRVTKTLKRMEDVIWNVTKDETLTMNDRLFLGNRTSDIKNVKKQIERYIKDYD